MNWSISRWSEWGPIEISDILPPGTPILGVVGRLFESQLGLRSFLVWQSAGTAGAGFITSSPEKTLEQARSAPHSASPAIPCAFSSSSSGLGQTEVKKGRFMASQVTSWVDAPGILSAAQQESGPNMLSETRPVGPLATFLYSIRQAALSPAPRPALSSATTENSAIWSPNEYRCPRDPSDLRRK